MLLAAQHPRTFCQPYTSGKAPPIHTSDVQSPSSPLPIKPAAHHQLKNPLNIRPFQINSVSLQQKIASRVAQFAHQPANCRRHRW